MSRRALLVSHSYYLRDTRLRRHAEGLIARAEQLAILTSFVDAARDHVCGLRLRAA